MTLLKPMIETLVAHHLKVTIYRLDGVQEPQATRHNVSAVITLLLFFTQQTIQRARRQGGSAPLLFEMPVKLGHANERYPRDIEINLPAVPQPVHETDMPRERKYHDSLRGSTVCVMVRWRLPLVKVTVQVVL